VVSRSNPGRSSRLRRTFDEEWLAESDALDFIDIDRRRRPGDELVPRPECFGRVAFAFRRRRRCTRATGDETVRR
jgi:hypothetical protein